MTTAKSIRNHIEQFPEGEPFTPATLLRFGTRKAVDLELARLVKSGRLARPARGVYIRPKHNQYVGTVPPPPLKIALARAGGPIEVHGAEAARRFGFSTQVPVQPVYYTTGSSKHIRYGGISITLKHISPRKLISPGTNVGLAIVALWYLGKNQVNPGTFRAIKQKLTDTEYEALKTNVTAMPAWMAEQFLRYEAGIANG